MDRQMTGSAAVARHYGLDWLRIGAFGLLILFHIGLYLSPWAWHISKRVPMEGVVYFLFVTNPWRMSLLFLVSGYAARALLSRGDGPGAFARSRTLRILVPLVFGILVIVPPQAWVEDQYQSGYEGGYLDFWAVKLAGLTRPGGWAHPNLGHLWFLAYIWVYSLILAGAAALLPPERRAAAQALFARTFRGWRLLVIPIAWQAFVRLLLLPGQMPSNRVWSDLPGHLVYLPVFLFGVALARSPQVWPSILRYWKPAVAIAFVGYVGTVWAYRGFPGSSVPIVDRGPIDRLFIVLATWPAILALLGVAERHLNRDHPWRAWLNEAVFPFYIIHQTLIVLGGWFLYHRRWGDAAEFLFLVSTTLAGCTLFYLAGRHLGPLRILIGLPASRKARPGPPVWPAGDAAGWRAARSVKR